MSNVARKRQQRSLSPSVHFNRKNRFVIADLSQYELTYRETNAPSPQCATCTDFEFVVKREPNPHLNRATAHQLATSTKLNSKIRVTEISALRKSHNDGAFLLYRLQEGRYVSFKQCLDSSKVTYSIPHKQVLVSHSK